MNGVYAIYEHFQSFQGEGVHMGRPAYFLRLHGCDQSCPWCDSAGTWHPDHKPQPGRVKRYGPIETANLVRDNASAGSIVVITGGEPALYDLDPLVRTLKAQGRRVHLETAGHRPIGAIASDLLDWVTLSPKPFATPPTRDMVDRADEFKIIVTEQKSIDDAMSHILKRGYTDRSHNRPVPIWLHPEWSKRNDQEVLDLITNSVTRANSPFRAGYQLHKLYRSDSLDPNSDTRQIPLGGDPRNGSSI